MECAKFTAGGGMKSLSGLKLRLCIRTYIYCTSNISFATCCTFFLDFFKRGSSAFLWISGYQCYTLKRNIHQDLSDNFICQVLSVGFHSFDYVLDLPRLLKKLNNFLLCEHIALHVFRHSQFLKKDISEYGYFLNSKD